MQEYIVRQHSVSSFAANWLCNKLSLSHVCFASSAINGDHQRRRRDLNPRAAINDLLPFQGSPFSRLGTSPQAPKSTGYVRPVECIERRGWDSNPRALADKRFSRPPRYDHFDTSPYFNFFQLKIAVCISDFVILSKSPILVNRFFKIFSKFFRQRFLRLPDPPVW